MKGARRTRKPRPHAGFAELMSPQSPPPNPRGVITGLGRNNTPTPSSVRSPPQPLSPPAPSPVDDDWSSLLNSTTPRRPSPSATPPRPPKSNSETSMKSLSSAAGKSVSDTPFSPTRNIKSPDRAPSSSSPFEKTSASPRSYSAQVVTSSVYVPPPPPVPSPAMPPKMVPPTAPPTGSVPSFMSGWEGADGWGDDPSLEDSDSDLNADDDAWGASWSPTVNTPVIEKPESDSKPPPPAPETSFLTQEPSTQQEASKSQDNTSFVQTSESSERPLADMEISAERTNDEAPLLDAFQPSSQGEDDNADAWGAWDDVVVPDDPEPEVAQPPEPDSTNSPLISQQSTPKAEQQTVETIAPISPTDDFFSVQVERPPEPPAVPSPSPAEPVPVEAIPPNDNVFLEQEEQRAEPPATEAPEPVQPAPADESLVAEDFFSRQEQLPKPQEVQSVSDTFSGKEQSAPYSVNPQSLKTDPTEVLDSVETNQKEFQYFNPRSPQHLEQSIPPTLPSETESTLSSSRTGPYSTDPNAPQQQPQDVSSPKREVQGIAAPEDTMVQVNAMSSEPEADSKPPPESVQSDSRHEFSDDVSKIPDTTSDALPIPSTEDNGWAWDPEQGGGAETENDEVENDQESKEKTSGFGNWDYEEVETSPGESGGWGWGVDPQAEDSSDAFGFKVGTTGTSFSQDVEQSDSGTRGKDIEERRIETEASPAEDNAGTAASVLHLNTGREEMAKDRKYSDQTGEKVQSGIVMPSDTSDCNQQTSFMEGSESFAASINSPIPIRSNSPVEDQLQKSPSEAKETVPSLHTDIQVPSNTTFGEVMLNASVEEDQRLDQLAHDDEADSIVNETAGSGIDFNSTDVDVSSIRGLTEVPSVASDRDDVHNVALEQQPAVKPADIVEGTANRVEDRSWVLEDPAPDSNAFPSKGGAEIADATASFPLIDSENRDMKTSWGIAEEAPGQLPGPHNAEPNEAPFANASHEQSDDQFSLGVSAHGISATAEIAFNGVAHTQSVAADSHSQQDQAFPVSISRSQNADSYWDSLAQTSQDVEALDSDKKILEDGNSKKEYMSEAVFPPRPPAPGAWEETPAPRQEEYNSFWTGKLESTVGCDSKDQFSSPQTFPQQVKDVESSFDSAPEKKVEFGHVPVLPQGNDSFTANGFGNNFGSEERGTGTENEGRHPDPAESSQVRNANEAWGEPLQKPSSVDNQPSSGTFDSILTQNIPLPAPVQANPDAAGAFVPENSVARGTGPPNVLHGEERRNAQEQRPENFASSTHSIGKSGSPESGRVASPGRSLAAGRSAPSATHTPVKESYDPFMYMTAADSKSESVNVGFEWGADGEAADASNSFGASLGGFDVGKAESTEHVYNSEAAAASNSFSTTGFKQEEKAVFNSPIAPNIAGAPSVQSPIADQTLPSNSSDIGNEKSLQYPVEGVVPSDNSPSYAPRNLQPSSGAPFWDETATTNPSDGDGRGDAWTSPDKTSPMVQNSFLAGNPPPLPHTPAADFETLPATSDVVVDNSRGHLEDAEDSFNAYAPRSSLQPPPPTGVQTDAYAPNILPSLPSNGDHQTSEYYPSMPAPASNGDSFHITGSSARTPPLPSTSAASFDQYAPQPQQAVSTTDTVDRSHYSPVAPPVAPPVDPSIQGPGSVSDQMNAYSMPESNVYTYAPQPTSEEYASDVYSNQYAPQATSSVAESFTVDSSVPQFPSFAAETSDDTLGAAQPPLQNMAANSEALMVSSAPSPPQEPITSNAYDSHNPYAPRPMQGNQTTQPQVPVVEPSYMQETALPYAPVPPPIPSSSERYAPESHQFNETVTTAEPPTNPEGSWNYPQSVGSGDVAAMYAPNSGTDVPKVEESPWNSVPVNASAGFAANEQQQPAPGVNDPSMNYSARPDEMVQGSSQQGLIPPFPGPPHTEGNQLVHPFDHTLYTGPDDGTGTSNAQPSVETDVYKPARPVDMQAEYSSYEDTSMYTYPYSIMDTAQVGELEYQPPRPTVSWGFGGSLVTVIPKSDGSTGSFGGSGPGSQSRSNVCLFDMKHIGHDGIDDELVSASEAITPLSYPVKYVDLLKYADMCERLSKCSVGLSGSAAESRAVLWRLLALMCRESKSNWRGVASAAISGPSHIKMFERSSDGSALTRRVSQSPLRLSEGVEKSDEFRREAAAQIEELMTQGKGREAVSKAQDAGLWSLALILSASTDKSLHMQMITQFAKSNLNDGSALQTLCLSMAENDAEIMRRATSESGLDEWRKAVGVLLASQQPQQGSKESRSLRMIEQVGETLISRRNDVVAGHVCFLLSGRISGLDRTNFPLLAAETNLQGGRLTKRCTASSALQSLIFEGILNAQRGETFPHILPFRFMLAQEIANMGRPEVALEHCVSISSAIRALFESGQGVAASEMFTQPFLHNLELVEQRLRGYLGLRPVTEQRGALSALGKSLSSVLGGRKSDSRTPPAPAAISNIDAVPRAGEVGRDSMGQMKQMQRMSISQDNVQSMEHTPPPPWAQNTSDSSAGALRTPPPAPESVSGNERWNSLISSTIRVLAPADGDLSPPPRPRMDGPGAIDQQPAPQLGLGHGTGSRAPGQDMNSNLRSASMGDMQAAWQDNNYTAGGMSHYSNTYGSHGAGNFGVAGDVGHGGMHTGGSNSQNSSEAPKDSGPKHRRSASDMTPGSQASEKKPPRPPKSSTTKSSVDDGGKAGLGTPLLRSFRSRLGDAIKSAFKGPKQAHMGSENKFKFDKDRGWYIEGEEMSAESSIPPPPPDDDTMNGGVGIGMDQPPMGPPMPDQDMSYAQGMQDLTPSPVGPPMYNTPNIGFDSSPELNARATSNAPPNYGSSQSWMGTPEATSESSVGSAASAPTPYIGGYTPAPPTSSSNKYRAGARRLSRKSVYVDTFNPNATPARAPHPQTASIRPSPSGISGFGGGGGGGYKIFTPGPGGADSSSSGAAPSPMADGRDASSFAESPMQQRGENRNEYMERKGA